MKKLIVFVMIAMLILSACSPTPATTESQETTKTGGETTTTDKQNDEPLTLTVLGRQKTGITFEEVQTVHAWEVLMDMFAANNLTLDFTIADPDQYSTILNASIASGDVTGLFLADVLTDVDRINLVEQEQVLDIDKVIEDYSNGTAAFEFSEDGLYYVSRQKNTYPTGGMYYFGNVSKQISVNHKVFGPNDVHANHWCMLIRQDWLDELNLPMPTTTEEYLDTLVAFQENDMNNNGVADERIPLYTGPSHEASWGTYFDTGIAQWFGLANGVFQLDRAGEKAAVPFLQEGFVPYVEFLQQCIAEEVIWLGDKVSKSNYGGGDDLDAMMMENVISSFFNLAINDYVNTPEEAKYVVMPAIQGVDGIKPTMTGSVGYKVWSSWGFSSKADPQAVAAFLDVLCTQDYAKWVTFGVEDETYYVDEESGMYTFTASNVIADILETKIGRGYPLVINAILPDASQIGWYQEYYGPLSWETYDEYLDSPYFKEVRAPMYGELMAQNNVEWCKQAEEYLNYNMNPDLDMTAPMNTLEEAEILELYDEELHTYFDEVFMGLLTGEYSLDSMEEYINTMYDLGLQEVWDIRQAQYDRYYGK